jgi:hypothetical protein
VQPADVRYVRQLPSTHTSFGLHAVAQSPQWSGSFRTLTHAVPHMRKSPVQAAMQVPEAHTGVAPLQAGEQAGSVHPPAAAASSGRHWQAPAVQYWLDEQRAQLAPQWAGSAAVNAHAPPQLANPDPVQLH